MDLCSDLEDPTDWPTDFTHLRELDHLLRCPICKEYFDTAMVTAHCGHTFCSLCVRRCLTQETKCPSCRSALTEGELHPNRLIDSLVAAFRNGRKHLLEALTKPAQSTMSGSKEPSAKKPKAEPRKRQRVHTRSMTRGLANGVELPASQLSSGRGTQQSSGEISPATFTTDLSASDIECLTTSDVDAAAAASGAEDSSYTEFPGNSSPPAHQPLDNDEDSDFMPKRSVRQDRLSPSHVLCPNCNRQVRQSRINWHLDRCLAGLSTTERPGGLAGFMAHPPTPSPSSHEALMAKGSAASAMGLRSVSSKFTLPRPTKLAYSLISESKLRRTLKELGIPSNGDKHQMQARHSEWVNMYLANADSESPISHRVLLKRLKAWGDNLARPVDTAKPPPPASRRDVADHTAKYADSFAALVAQAKETRTKTPDTSDSAGPVVAPETPPETQ
ncbi:hypothetical protein GQ54DRAFT_295193 [Martensiomyces pterosporus]|nr:hypothetical protein GQ54DRAFT_295193 [Martensiomyces pterosporus]